MQKILLSIVKAYHIVGKFGGFSQYTLFKHLAWQMNRSAEGLLIVTNALYGFSLVNGR